MPKHLALVIPWFGEHLAGGAEQIAWQIATRMAAREHRVEVLTTCCAAFQEDWSRNHLRKGKERHHGITVRRFPVRRRDLRAFDGANSRLLGVPASALRPGRAPVPAEIEALFVAENIHAPALDAHLRSRASRYDAIVFLPYLYGPTLAGLPTVADRAWLHPCLHDEAYAYLPTVSDCFANARGLLFNSEGEAALAARLYGPAIWSKGTVVGAGIEVPEGDSPRGQEPGGDSFRQGHDLATCLERAGDHFVLHLGRRDPPKNLPFLLDAWQRAGVGREPAAMRLVLCGPGPAPAPLPEGCVDLGRVSEPAKRALLARCTALAQPSTNESYSRVMMEAWSAARPVVVHGACPATERELRSARGGFAPNAADEWIAVLRTLAEPATRELLDELGRQGRAHAREASNWDHVIDRYERALGFDAERAPPPRRWRGTTRTRSVHQLLPTLAYGDAIGNHALFWRDWLRGLGFHSEIFYRHCDERRAEDGRPFHPSLLSPSHGIVYHHSIGSELTAHAVRHAGPKLLVNHNVTPSRFYKDWEPGFAALLEAGEKELAELAPAFENSVGDSSFNAAGLAKAGFESPGVLPIAVDPATWREPPDPAWLERLQDGGINLLFVGRLAPNKRQEDLIACLPAVLERIPRARLVLAGPSRAGDPYAASLRVLAERLGVASRVLVTGPLTQAQLHACFRAAHLYWSLSEHEGFGVPLVEAMWFDVPVLAYHATAVPETLGAAGLLVREKRPREMAALVERLLGDASLRKAVLRAQELRRRDFTPEALDARYRAALSRVLGEDLA